MADVTDKTHLSTKSLPIPPPPAPPPCTNQHERLSKALDIAVSQKSSRIKDISVQSRRILQDASLTNDVKWLLCNADVRPKLQGKAPRCGIAALSMAAEMAGCTFYSTQHGTNTTSFSNDESELAHLVTLAKHHGYSKQGEMFCAENLAALGQEFYGLVTAVTECSFSERDRIIGHLFSGNPILVPYDPASNHEPCLLNGTKAHWALLTGFLCAFDDNEYDWTNLQSLANILNHEPTLYHVKSPVTEGLTLPKNILLEQIHFFARQPKSRHVGIWSLRSLEQSNSNLLEFNPREGEHLENFVLPAGGLRKGLCSKLIFLSTSPTAL